MIKFPLSSPVILDPEPNMLQETATKQEQSFIGDANGMTWNEAW